MDARLGTRVNIRAWYAADFLLGGAVDGKSTENNNMSLHWLIVTLLQTGGYDGSMLNGLNILPSYTDYFNLDPATTGLNTASVFSAELSTTV